MSEQTLRPWTQSIEGALNAHRSSADGLSSAEASTRQKHFGTNELPEAEVAGIFEIFFRQFLNPLIYVLLLAGGISLALGHMKDGLFIAAVLLINAVIGAVQEFSAQKSALSLKKMSRSQAFVRRDHRRMRIDVASIVPGDIVFLESGVRVPADCRLVSAQNLAVDESILTGESVAVEKPSAETVCSADTVLPERKNMLHSGTMIARGRAMGLVTATGAQTELGKIAIEVTRRDDSKPPLLVRMEGFTKNLAVIFAVVCGLIGGILLLTGQPWDQVLLVSAALAVSAIPEGLPVALTIALAIAMNRMSKRGVIARSLTAIEALGSCTYIASDKTGTLTVNQMTVKIACPFGGAPTVIRGEGYEPVPKMEEPGLLDMGECAILSSETGVTLEDGAWIAQGDSVDAAAVVFGAKLGLNPESLRARSKFVSSFPFESQNRFSAFCLERGGKATVFAKGAFETLGSMCDGIGPEVEQEVDRLAREGYRVLALARKDEKHERIDPQRLTGMKFLGLIGMIDPIRPEAREALKKCRHAGIEVTMVTGDHPTTALAIARELDLAQTESQVATGKDLRRGDTDLVELAKNTRVFSRLEPSQKLDIVRAIRQAGHFVAVTGDGVNDAPALKEAHVGVSMGQSGTDVAKETSDLILTDDNFTSIVAGIEEGRVAYANVRKVIFLLLSTGAAEIVVFSLGLATGYPIPLTAVQLLWLNVVTNGLQDVALAFEPGEGDELSQPPRPVDEPVFNRVMVERILLSAATGGVVGFFLFRGLLEAGVATDAARNSLLLFFVFYENILIGSSRSEHKSVFRINPFSNPFLLYAAVGAQALHLFAMNNPFLAGILNLAPVSFSHWTQLLGLGMTVLLANEIYLRVKKKRAPDY